MAINYWCLHIQYAWEHTAHMHAQKVMPGTFRKKCISHTTSISFLLVYINKDLSKSENTSGGALWHYYFQYQFIYTDSSTKENRKSGYYSVLLTIYTKNFDSLIASYLKYHTTGHNYLM